MFIAVSDEHKPYVLAYDRADDRPVKTLWWIRPMIAEESSAYHARWRKVGEQYDLSTPNRAREQTKIDREKLLEVLSHVENAYVEGDKVEGAELARLVNEQLNDLSLQEMILASKNVAQLEAGAKKS